MQTATDKDWVSTSCYQAFVVDAPRESELQSSMHRSNKNAFANMTNDRGMTLLMSRQSH